MKLRTRGDHEQTTGVIAELLSNVLGQIEHRQNEQNGQIETNEYLKEDVTFGH